MNQVVNALQSEVEMIGSTAEEQGTVEQGTDD